MIIVSALSLSLRDKEREREKREIELDNSGPKIRCLECDREIARGSILHHHTIQGCKQMRLTNFKHTLSLKRDFVSFKNYLHLNFINVHQDMTMLNFKS